jgi:outer membrane protein assembly factor BamB
MLRLVGPREGATSSREEARARRVRDVLAPLLCRELGLEILEARLGPAEARGLAHELAFAALELLARGKSRASVRLPIPGEPWELGLERAGDVVLASLFSAGEEPLVVLHEARIGAEALRDALVRMLEQNGVAEAGAGDWARATLEALTFARVGEVEAVPALVEPTGDLAMVIAGEVWLRPTPPAASTALRAELLPLLVRGRLRVVLGEHAREVSGLLVFLVADRLVSLTAEALAASARGRPYHRLVEAGDAMIGVRLDEHGAASLTLRASTNGRPVAWTFPAMDLTALARAVSAFGRALARTFVRRDRAYASNLRLIAFKNKVRELGEELRGPSARELSLVNASPESYRAFARGQSARQQDGAQVGRLRYQTRWTSTVAGLDLRSTFLCGPRLVACGARDVGCLDSQTGVELWRRPAPRAASVITPAGLARIEPTGRVTLHGLDDGRPAWSTSITPRVGASTSGVVVAAPGLPRLLVLTEGQRSVAAIELSTGETRWRHAFRRGSSLRLRRVGRLVFVVSSERSLTALDVVTGDVVWRLGDRQRFSSPVAMDRDELFAVAGDGGVTGRAPCRLFSLDAWSGELRSVFSLPAHVTPVGAPMPAAETVLLAAHDRRGARVVGLDRHSGEVRFEVAACAAEASCLLVDDTLVVNGENGEVVGLDASTGAVRYRHYFPTGAEGDRPRRLEPVLRSGALFLPQIEVHIMRPRDGAVLGRIATDLVPDMLRVDEACNVFAAEESGHLAAYGALRLSVV